jgi:hypothetical protein
MASIGYARVSTFDQDHATQEERLKTASVRQWPSDARSLRQAPPFSRDLSASEGTGDPRAIRIVRDCIGFRVRFQFIGSQERATHPSLSAEQQGRFKMSFGTEVKAVKSWFVEQGWIDDRDSNPMLTSPAFGRAHLPAALQVLVSDECRFARALWPAWIGKRGVMEFPEHRVANGEANVAHELVHVFFPNANRMLAEGIAVYLQQKIGGNPAFPNFGKELHQMVRDFGGVRDSGRILSKLSLMSLDKIATPNDLFLRIGRTVYPSRTGFPYLVAGSFIQFLIENVPIGLDKFSDLYAQTPLIPMKYDSGKPDRWKTVYGFSLAQLEFRWKSFISALPPPR